jgi:hypothetical protein
LGTSRRSDGMNKVQTGCIFFLFVKQEFDPVMNMPEPKHSPLEGTESLQDGWVTGTFPAKSSPPADKHHRDSAQESDALSHLEEGWDKSK